MTHDERVYHHLYVDSKSPLENAERIAELEELVQNIDAVHMSGYDCTECPFYDECKTDAGCHAWGIIHDHMRRLGLEDE